MLSTGQRHERPISSPILPRALRREWKRYKPHLSKSTSLPSFQLLPKNRPLFTCLQCGFTNSQIPLCLWCAWTSEEATKEFEKNSSLCVKQRVRGRRVSSPARIGDDEVKAANERTSVSTCPQSDDIVSERVIPDSTTILADPLPSLSAHDGNKNHMRSSKRYGMITSTSDTRRESRPSSVQHQRSSRSSQVKVRSARVRSRQPEPIVAAEDSEEPIFTSCALSDPNVTDLTSLMPAPQSSSHQAPSVSRSLLKPHPRQTKTPNTNVAVPRPSHPLMHSASSLSLSQPERTIRRKKRMTLLKQKSSRSLRTRASAPLLSANLNNDASVGDVIPAPTRMSTHTPISAPPVSMPQTPTTVRLGHPSRPYYTAIRPNMSRPSSPFDNSARTSPLASRAPSPSFSSPHSIPYTSSHMSDTLHPPNFPPSSSRSSYPSYLGADTYNNNATIGFSLSGETELRMALARWRSADGDRDGDSAREGQRSEYRFRETANVSATGSSNVRSKRGKANESGKFGGKMKRLGMGILELVLGRK